MNWDTNRIMEWNTGDETDWDEAHNNNFHDVSSDDLADKSCELQEIIEEQIYDDDDLYLLLEIERELTRRGE